MARAVDARVIVHMGPAEAWADLLVGLHTVIDGDARGGQTVRDSVTALLEAFAARGPFIESRPDSPRVWSLPTEPGPEVTAVRVDGHGTWRRADELHGWFGAQTMRDGSVLANVLPWRGLLALGDLTDVSSTTDNGSAHA